MQREMVARHSAKREAITALSEIQYFLNYHQYYLLIASSWYTRLIGLLHRKQKAKQNRHVGRFNWNCGWFQEIWNTVNDERFKSRFRLLRENFNTILNRVGHHQTHDITAEEPMLPQVRLGISLCRLSRGDYYHTIAEMTERKLTTVHCVT